MLGQFARAGMAHRHRRVRLQEQQRHRPADDDTAPDDDGILPCNIDPRVLEQPHNAGRRARNEARPSNQQRSHVDRAEAVDILRRVDALEHRTRIDVRGHRLLRKNPVDIRARIQIRNERKQFGLGRARRQVKRL